MNAQDFIISKLEELKKPDGLAKPSSEQLEAEIVRLILSKKFRKYSANESLVDQVKHAVHLSVSKNEPINFAFLHGAYKLWRLEETPEVDWAELFSLMYYSKWLKPICEIYEPGVWFDSYVDDTIIKRIDNISQDEIDAYIISYRKLIDFLSEYQPKNLKMTMTTSSSQLGGEEALDKQIDENLPKTEFPVLDDAQRKMVEMNVRLKPGQDDDPEWREKIMHVHNAYAGIKRSATYAYGQDNKILVFSQPLPSGRFVAVGTTKNSIMKFWIGVGVLKRKDEAFEPTILSSGQLKGQSFDIQDVSISGLTGKNFSKIRVLK